MLFTSDLRQLLDFIEHYVNRGEGSYLDKRQRLLSLASDRQKLALLEFADWFTDGEDDQKDQKGDKE